MSDEVDALAAELNLDAGQPAPVEEHASTGVGEVSGVEVLAGEMRRTELAKQEFEYKLKTLQAEEQSERERLRLAQETLQTQMMATEMLLLEKELKEKELTVSMHARKPSGGPVLQRAASKRDVRGLERQGSRRGMSSLQESQLMRSASKRLLEQGSKRSLQSDGRAEQLTRSSSKRSLDGGATSKNRPSVDLDVMKQTQGSMSRLGSKRQLSLIDEGAAAASTRKKTLALPSFNDVVFAGKHSIFTDPALPVPKDFAAVYKQLFDSRAQLLSGAPMVGVELQLLDSRGAGGVVVAAVQEGRPCAVAGIRAGDVIVSIGDTKTPERSNFAKALSECKPGNMVLFVTRRDGVERKVRVEIGSQSFATDELHRLKRAIASAACCLFYVTDSNAEAEAELEEDNFAELNEAYRALLGLAPTAQPEDVKYYMEWQVTGEKLEKSLFSSPPYLELCRARTPVWEKQLLSPAGFSVSSNSTQFRVFLVSLQKICANGLDRPILIRLQRFIDDDRTEDFGEVCTTLAAVQRSINRPLPVLKVGAIQLTQHEMVGVELDEKGQSEFMSPTHQKGAQDASSLPGAVPAAAARSLASQASKSRLKAPQLPLSPLQESPNPDQRQIVAARTDGEGDDKLSDLPTVPLKRLHARSASADADSANATEASNGGEKALLAAKAKSGWASLRAHTMKNLKVAPQEAVRKTSAAPGSPSASKKSVKSKPPPRYATDASQTLTFKAVRLCVDTTYGAMSFGRPNDAIEGKRAIDVSKHTECSVWMFLAVEGVFRHGFCHTKKSVQPYLELYRVEADTSLATDPVHRTEKADRGRRGSYKPFAVKLHDLCFGSALHPFLVRCRDAETSNVIGECYVSLKGMNDFYADKTKFKLRLPQSPDEDDARGYLSFSKRPRIFTRLDDLRLLATHAGLLKSEHERALARAKAMSDGSFVTPSSKTSLKIHEVLCAEKERLLEGATAWLQ